MSALNALAAEVAKNNVLIPILLDYLRREAAQIASGAISRKASVVEDSKMTIAACKERIKEFNHGEKIEGNLFHPSALGNCLRATWFDWLGAKGQRPGSEDVLRSHLTFDQGSHIHLLLQNLCDRAGILEAREIAINDPVRLTLGHADGIVVIKGVRYVLEIKSINSRGFTELSKHPKHAHVQQVMDYMRCLGLKHGIVLYMDKDAGRLKEFVVPYDSEFYKQHVRDRKRRFFQHLADVSPPDKEGSTPRSAPCSYCSFSNICFSPDAVKQFIRDKRKALSKVSK